ncbi:MAG: hypothetical protein IPL64_06555 [Flavobacteriales bacterium]|nr:hypothetical protein [Flavobacteriales bacterium]
MHLTDVRGLHLCIDPSGKVGGSAGDHQLPNGTGGPERIDEDRVAVREHAITWEYTLVRVRIQSEQSGRPVFELVRRKPLWRCSDQVRIHRMEVGCDALRFIGERNAMVSFQQGILVVAPFAIHLA